MCFSKLSRMAIAILWTCGSVWTFSLMLYKCCKPPSSINMLQYLAAVVRFRKRELKQKKYLG